MPKENLLNILETHSFKPKDVLNLLRENSDNNQCFYCKKEGPNCAQLDVGRIICAKCASHLRKKDSRNIKSLLFDKLEKGQLLRLCIFGNTAKKSDDQQDISEYQTDTLLIDQIDQEIASLKKNDKFTLKSSTSPLNSESSDAPKKSKKLGSISIEALKNKKQTTDEQLPVSSVKPVKINKIEEAQPESIQFISLDRPMAKYKYKGADDIGLVQKESVKKEESTYEMSYGNLKFAKKQHVKTKSEIIKEKGKNIVDGLMARFKRDNV